MYTLLNVFVATVFVVIFLLLVVKRLVLSVYGIKPTPIGKVKLDRFIPYDVVIETKMLSEAQNKTGNPTEPNKIKIGLVVGFERLHLDQEPLYIKVLHFNNLNPNKPIIKTYHADELTLLQSPLDQMQMLASLYSVQANTTTSAQKKIKETIH